MAKIADEIKLYFIIGLLFLTLTIWAVYFSQPDQNVHIYFFDVGQGDSSLIQKEDFQILIDGGPDSSVVEKLSSVMPLDDRKIEKVIVTHPHADHIFGLNEIIKRYEIEEILFFKTNYESGVYKNLLELIDSNQIKKRSPEIGETEYVFDKGKITYLWPEKEIEKFEKNINNTSIVFRFDYGKFNSLFTGDAETESWKEIFQRHQKFLENILLIKIPHHGSRTGLSEHMTNIINPSIAIISLGANNKFGFPHKEIIDYLNKTQTKVYRTDTHGNIEIVTNGDNWQIK